MNEVWEVARKTHTEADSRSLLLNLGFQIVDDSDPLFYRVLVPSGWTKTTEGSWISIKDPSGKERLTQFNKLPVYSPYICRV